MPLTRGASATNRPAPPCELPAPLWPPLGFLGARLAIATLENDTVTSGGESAVTTEERWMDAHQRARTPATWDVAQTTPCGLQRQTSLERKTLPMSTPATTQIEDMTSNRATTHNADDHDDDEPWMNVSWYAGKN